MLTFAQTDNSGKNAMYDCWRNVNPDNGEVGEWGPLFPRPYDMDTQMGLANDGTSTKTPAGELASSLSPTMSKNNNATIRQQNEKDLTHSRYDEFSVTKSRLWRFFAIAFATEIREAYRRLRTPPDKTTPAVYDANAINSFVSALTSAKIGERFYNRDAGAKYLN
jgi:hypothetical protein